MSTSTKPFELSESELAAQADREGNHPFALGQQAARDGQKLDTNPFPRRSQNALAFKRGWDSVVAEKSKGGAAQETPQAETTPAPSNKKKSVAEQQDLPGTEEFKPKRDKAIHEAAEKYAVARDARMAATEEEVKCKQFLIELMQKKDVTEYRFGNVEVELVPSEIKLKVRIKEDEE